VTRGQHASAETTAKEILRQAAPTDDAAGLVAGNVEVGISDLHMAKLADARLHFDEALGIYRATDEAEGKRLAYEYGVDFGTAGCAYAAWCYWLLGYPDRSARLGDEALAKGDRIQHGYSRARGLYWNSALHALRREWPIVEERAAAAIALARERGLTMVVAAGGIMQGAARAMLNPRDEAVAEMREGLAAYRATGARLQSSHHGVLLAAALAACRQYDEALSILREMTGLVQETGERYVEAEIHRLQGNILLAKDGAGTPAERCYSLALEAARTQGARSLELRATTDLVRMWAERGERRRAHELLAPVYGRFTEGFDTLDLKEAKRLLDELA
jgi:predicted ATPase